MCVTRLKHRVLVIVIWTDFIHLSSLRLCEVPVPSPTVEKGPSQLGLVASQQQQAESRTWDLNLDRAEEEEVVQICSQVHGPFFFFHLLPIFSSSDEEIKRQVFCGEVFCRYAEPVATIYATGSFPVGMASRDTPRPPPTLYWPVCHVAAGLTVTCCCYCPRLPGHRVCMEEEKLEVVWKKKFFNHVAFTSKDIWYVSSFDSSLNHTHDITNNESRHWKELF